MLIKPDGTEMGKGSRQRAQAEQVGWERQVRRQGEQEGQGQALRLKLQVSQLCWALGQRKFSYSSIPPIHTAGG